VASDDFPKLVERTRLATNAVCAQARLVLRPLLPGVEALPKDNAHFSPRLMRMMLSRTGEQLSPSDRQCLNDLLQDVEAFQPQLLAWMAAMKERRATAVGTGDSQECSRGLDRMTKHLADLELLLAKFDDGRRTS
jgi:hypothetical protein